MPHRIVARNFILRATPKCSSIAVEKFEEFWNGHFEIQVAARNRVSMEHIHGEINASPFQVYLSQPGSSPFQTPVFIHIRDTVRCAENELRVANQGLRNLRLEFVTLSALPELTAFLELPTAPNAGVRGRLRILVPLPGSTVCKTGQHLGMGVPAQHTAQRAVLIQVHRQRRCGLDRQHGTSDAFCPVSQVGLMPD